MEGQQVLLCPQCGGNKIKTENTGKIILRLANLSAISIIGIPFALIFYCVWYTKKHIRKNDIFAFCSECRYKWFISNTKFDEHESIVKRNERLQA